jgi:hypothetical protein
MHFVSKHSCVEFKAELNPISNLITLKENLMKNLILSIVVTLFSAVAFAAPLRCVTVPTRPDTGYVMTFNNRVDKVLVEQITIAGARKVATLVCSTNSKKTPNHPDKMSVWFFSGFKDRWNRWFSRCDFV